jgi:hypothetical protein
VTDAPRTGRPDRDWVTLLGGVRVSRQWMTRHTPELLAAWLDAATAARRRSIAADRAHRGRTRERAGRR